MTDGRRGRHERERTSVMQFVSTSNMGARTWNIEDFCVVHERNQIFSAGGFYVRLRQPLRQEEKVSAKATRSLRDTSDNLLLVKTSKKENGERGYETAISL